MIVQYRMDCIREATATEPPVLVPTFRLDERSQKVFMALINERKFQDAKWGTIDNGPNDTNGSGAHSLSGWLLLIRKELEEAEDAMIKGGEGRDSLRSEIIQTMALCFACLEQHGVEDPHNGRQV